MRKLPWLQAERYRLPLIGTAHESHYGDPYGAFAIPRKTGVLRVLVSDGDYVSAQLTNEFAWEHVSVSLEERVPTWEEMCYVKDLFWRDDECVVQYHPPKAEYINNHLNVLHMWRPLNIEFPMPPRLAV